MLNQNLCRSPPQADRVTFAVAFARPRGEAGSAVTLLTAANDASVASAPHLQSPPGHGGHLLTPDRYP
jgi:hypothetical protein